MAPKGLNVGDTFNEEGYTYKVLKVVGENYESQMIRTPVGFLATEDVKVDNKIDLSTLPYAQLKKMCAERRIDAKGSKEDLIARLEGIYEYMV